jgi:asparagine synthase (glutamine-hydrolysing)
MMPARRRMTGLADRLPKIARLLEANTSAEVYRQLVSHQANPQSYVIGASDAADNLSRDASFDDMRHDMMYLDSITYLPDDILVKVDRASMAVSLESRVPFLDHRVIEYAWRLPPSAKFRDGRGKHILREILYRHVPRSLADRPKTGFTPPINAWLRGPLRQWAEDLLDERRLRDEGFFVVSQVRALWLDLLAGHRRHDQVWAILMFQAWWAEMRSQPVRTSRHIGKSFQYA